VRVEQPSYCFRSGAANSLFPVTGEQGQLPAWLGHIVADTLKTLFTHARLDEDAMKMRKVSDVADSLRYKAEKYATSRGRD
jgi:cellobiose phosphorylase